MQLTSVIFWFSRLKKYFVLSFYLKQELLIKGNPKNFRFGNYKNIRKQQGYCSVGYARVVERSEKFDSIKYKNQRSAKLICDPKLIPINQK